MLELIDGLAFVNSTGSTIPAGACLEVVSLASSEKEIIVTVQKPTTSGISKKLIAFNGPAEVENGRAGILVANALVLVKGDGTSYTVGDEVGPVDSQWYMSSAGQGYAFWGNEPNAAFTDAMIVAAKGGGTFGGFAVTPVGGVPARTGTSTPYTPGSASCVLCEVYTSGVKKIRTKSPTVSMTLYNVTTTDVGELKLVAWSYRDGLPTIDVESCGTS